MRIIEYSSGCLGITSNTLMLGFQNNSERGIYFFSNDGSRKAYLYGGNSSSATSLGVWDDSDTNGGSVWMWSSSQNRFTINKPTYINSHIYIASGMVMNFNEHNTIYANDSHDVRFGYGSYTNKAGKIYVHGDYLKFYTNQSNIYGNVAYSVNSDRRYKKDIEDINEKLINVWEKINVQTFRYKKNDSARNIGVIAQEVIEAFESEGLDWKEYNVVSEAYDDEANSNRYTVCYDGLNMLTMKVLQLLIKERKTTKE